MAVELADAYVSIVPSGRGLQQAIANQFGNAGFAQHGTNAGNQAAAGFSGSFTAGIAKVAAIAGAALAAVGIGQFVTGAVSAASDLNETLSKSAAIFGDQAASIEAWGDTAAKTLGLSKAEALAAAASFGDMFTQLGFAGDAAADMSKDVVQVAADLGSFNNLDTGDVADRIAAAFRGEYDSLQAVIPNINAARVETEALAATGKTAAKELTAQEKAAAVLAIVHEDGAKAAGDFAKTSNGLANQQKILSASFEDIKAKIGTALLPVLTKVGAYLIDYVVPVVSQFASQLADRLGPATLQIAQWVQTVLVPALASLWSWFQEKVLPALQVLAETLIGAVQSALAMIGQAIEDNSEQLSTLWGWLKTAAEFILTYVVPVLGDLAKNLIESVGAAITLVIKIISGLVKAIEWIVDAGQTMVDGVSSAIGDVKAAFTTAKDWVGEKVGEIVGFFTGLPGKIEAVGDALLTAGKEIMGKLFDGMKNVAGGVAGLAADIGRSILDGINNVLNLPLVVGPFKIPLAPDVPAFTLLPAFADGAYVTSATAGVFGEAGREVIMPLTRPDRMWALAKQSGLFEAMGIGSGFGVPDNRPAAKFDVYEAVSAEATAQAMANRLEMFA